MEKIRNKKCPFCGADKIRLVAQEDTTGQDGFSMMCDECGAMGPFVDNGQEAVELWNKRKIKK